MLLLLGTVAKLLGRLHGGQQKRPGVTTRHLAWEKNAERTKCYSRNGYDPGTLPAPALGVRSFRRVNPTLAMVASIGSSVAEEGGLFLAIFLYQQ